MLGGDEAVDWRTGGRWLCDECSTSSSSSSPSSSCTTCGRINGGSLAAISFPERQSIMSITIEAHQQTRTYFNRDNTAGTPRYTPNASQKNIAPDFFVMHHP